MIQVIGLIVCIYTAVKMLQAPMFAALLAPTVEERFWDLMTNSYQTRIKAVDVGMMKVWIGITSWLAMIAIVILCCYLLSIRIKI